MEEQAPMDFYDGEGKLLYNLQVIGPSSIQFCDDLNEIVFMINKDGCHVPLGVSADEAAQVVIKRLDDHIKNLVKSLEKENAELKAKIAGGIRVHAEREGIMYWECSEAMVIKNATLLLDKGE